MRLRKALGDMFSTSTFLAHRHYNRVFAENLLGLGFLVVCFLHKTKSHTHEKLFAVGKSGPIVTFYLIFLGVGLALGWGVRRLHNNVYLVDVFQPNRNR